jgi:serine/threonine protein kinase
MDASHRSKSFLAKNKSHHEGKIIAGKYRYLRVLGTGGMGEVHLVADIATSQKMAIKCCFDETYAKRFEHEVLSWIKIGKHPNLVAALYFDRVDDVPTLFIEYVEGGNLKSVIEESAQKKEDIPFDKVLDYAIQICRGMEHLHKNGVIHRDLKPSNIMIANEVNGPGHIKITDMGISKIKGISDPPPDKDGSKKLSHRMEKIYDVAPADLTRTNEMLGTPQYMSPQQYTSSKRVAEDTDIYAFGLILYEMLTQGKKPFEADNSQGWFYAHTYSAPKHVKTQISSKFSLFRRKSRAQLYDLVMQCLSKNAYERPSSFCEIEDKLKAIYSQISGKEYSRGQMLSDTDLSEEEINNQAVSLLEMGPDYVEQGRQKLDELCASAPDCLEAQLNRLLFQLKNNLYTLNDFWNEGCKLLTSDTAENRKVAAVLSAGALERGSYYQESMRLLADLGKIEDSPELLRLKAKWMYLAGHYIESIPLWENLSVGEFRQNEDFYHHAGAYLLADLQRQKARLCFHKGRFSVELESLSKQKIWYILRDGEEKCGPGSWLERGKDVAIGAVMPMSPFWHEHAILTGHEGAVTSIAVTPDAKAALSGGADHTVRLWDVAQQKQLCFFQEHTAPINCVAIEAQGKYGASGSADGTLRIWDLEAQHMLFMFQHRAPVTAVALNPDKGWAVSAGIDGMLRLWNLTSLWQGKSIWYFLQRRELRAFPSLHGAVHSVAVGNEGKCLLAGCADGSVQLWDMEQTKPVAVSFVGHEGPVTRVAVSADGKWAVSVSDSAKHNVFLWDLAKHEKLISFPCAKQGMRSLAIAANAYWILVAADNNEIHVWDLKWQKRKIATLEIRGEKVCDLAATLQGNFALAAGSQGTIRIWQNSFIWPLIREHKYLKVVPRA